MSKEYKHYFSLIFSFVMTFIDFLNSHVDVNPLILIESLIVVIVIYYLIARVSITILEIIFKNNK